MPGKIALFLYPNFLKKIKLPEITIAVTGSNGKTSTVEMINEILTQAGYSVAYNSEGSNQIDGIATTILTNCDYSGSFDKDVLLMESDERYAQYTFKYFSPKYFVITNLFRDQMTRNGNPEYVLSQVQKAINKDMKLVINADDPLIATLANENTCLFGINENLYSKDENNYIYDDGYYCPKCKSKLVYDYRQFGHVGSYHCSNCDFTRGKLNYFVSEIYLNKKEIVINNGYKVNLAFDSIYNIYNILASFAVCNLVGVDPSIIVSSINNYLIKNGRIINFKLGNNRGLLLISKHENSVSYNQNIEYITSQKKNCTVILIVDSISRKYFTSDTSWLWDINFESLNNDYIDEIVVTGQYSADLAERLEYAGIDMSKVYIDKNIKPALKYASDIDNKFIYTLTCFSDENKFLNRTGATW